MRVKKDAKNTDKRKKPIKIAEDQLQISLLDCLAASKMDRKIIILATNSRLRLQSSAKKKVSLKRFR